MPLKIEIKLKGLGILVVNSLEDKTVVTETKTLDFFSGLANGQLMEHWDKRTAYNTVNCLGCEPPTTIEILTTENYTQK